MVSEKFTLKTMWIILSQKDAFQHGHKKVCRHYDFLDRNSELSNHLPLVMKFFGLTEENQSRILNMCDIELRENNPFSPLAGEIAKRCSTSNVF